MDNPITPRQQQMLLQMADRMADDLQGYLDDCLDKAAPCAKWTQHLIDQYQPLRASIKYNLGNHDGGKQ